MKTWKGKHGVYLIAEIGGNHEGDFNKAKELAELACKSGVDAVKFQIFTADSLVNKIEDPKRHAHYKKFELTSEQHIALSEICHNNKVTYSASVWDMNALEWINPYMKFYKVGSGDLTAYSILEKIAKTKKPIILSTGLSSFREIRDAVALIQSIDKRYMNEDYFALLQCTTNYPTPDSEANLCTMQSLSKHFGLPVGYSDHTKNAYAAEIAVAMGAQILELHFTDDISKTSFRDHQISFTIDDIQKLMEKIKKIKLLMGSGMKKSTMSEIETDHLELWRRSIYAARDISKGEVLSESDVIVLRPNHGLDARSIKKIIGKRLKMNVNRYDSFDLEMFY